MGFFRHFGTETFEFQSKCSELVQVSIGNCIFSTNLSEHFMNYLYYPRNSKWVALILSFFVYYDDDNNKSFNTKLAGVLVANDENIFTFISSLWRVLNVHTTTQNEAAKESDGPKVGDKIRISPTLSSKTFPAESTLSFADKFHKIIGTPHLKTANTADYVMARTDDIVNFVNRVFFDVSSCI